VKYVCCDEVNADCGPQDDTPGRFYESSIDVPNNTPCCSSAAPDSPRSAFTDNLAVIDERLEELPGPYASKPSTPAPSVFGTSTSKFNFFSFAFMPHATFKSTFLPAFALPDTPKVWRQAAAAGFSSCDR
jgi:hypothetical protein